MIIRLGTLIVAVVLGNGLAAAESGEERISVPMIDGRQQSEVAVEAKGAFASDDSIVLVFYGPDAKLLEDTKDLAREAIGKELPIRGIVVGPGQTSYVDVYTEGQVVNKVPLTNKAEISIGIEGAYEYLKYLRENGR